jgi:transcription termination/antitermination protein NusG
LSEMQTTSNVIAGSAPAAVSAHSQSRFWVAVQVRSRHEKVVAAQLEKKGIENYLPLVTERRQWSDRSKSISLPLFPNYIFARCNPAGSDRVHLLQTLGVTRILGSGSIWDEIPEKQLQDVRLLLEQFSSYAPYPFCRAGQRVRIRGGCLDGVEGIFVERNHDQSLVISIEIIQRSVAVRVSGYQLEVIQP